MRIRRLTAATLAAIILPAAFGAISAHAAQPLPPGMSEADLAGIELLPSTPELQAPLPATLGRALDTATTLAEKHPDDLGMPWPDRSTGRIVTPTVTTRGDALAAGVQNRRRVSRGYSALKRIQDAVSARAAFPGSDAIVATEPDPEHDRVILWADRLDRGLTRTLAKRFGTKAIAIRYMPFLAGSRAANNQTRWEDGPTYFGGGAWINMYSSSGEAGCTSGIPWYYNDKSQMITAGHCAPSGAYVTAGANTEVAFGSVYTGTDETWTDGVGSVKLPGQSVYHGDIARIQMSLDGDSGSSAAHSGYYVFSGGSASGSVRVVTEMWSRRAAVGDQYCTDGSRSYELCGWTVVAVGTTWTYTGDAGSPVARQIVVGLKESGTCMKAGDSGGPTYTVKSDGSVAVKGIISGATMSYSTGTSDNPCVSIFTDAYDVMEAFGGGPRYL